MLQASERIIFRKFTFDDVHSFIAYRSDPEISKYQSWSENLNVETITSFVEEQQNLRIGDLTWVQVLMEENQENQHIGDMGIKSFDEGRQVEFGITIAKVFQQKGYASEALYTLFIHLFTQLEIHRVVATIDAENIASIRLMEKLGMRNEAYHVKSYFQNNSWTDEVVYAITKNEFMHNTLN